MGTPNLQLVTVYKTFEKIVTFKNKKIIDQGLQQELKLL